MKDMNWPERVAYLENQLADSDRDNQRLREFIEGLPDGDEIVRLRGLLTRIHGIAAEPRPVNTEVRLENIACIASGERDATYAQLAEAQRFPHGAAAVTGLTQQDYDALVRDAMLWRTRSPTGAGGNAKAFVCCEGVGQHAPGCTTVSASGVQK